MYKFYAKENYDTPKANGDAQKYQFYISIIFKTQDTFKTRSLSLKLYFVQSLSTYLYYYAPISQVCSNNECNKKSIYVQTKQKYLCTYLKVVLVLIIEIIYAISKKVKWKISETILCVIVYYMVKLKKIFWNRYITKNRKGLRKKCFLSQSINGPYL